MRIRSKLLVAMIVPLGLLVTQIVVMHVFIRELQVAVAFIASAHQVIEANLTAADLVGTLRQEVKKLPSQYVSPQKQAPEEAIALRASWEKLTALIGVVRTSHAMQSIKPGLLETVTQAFSSATQEYEKTVAVAVSGTADLDALLDRAISINKSLEALAEALDILTIELRQQLQTAVEREQQLHNRPIRAGIAIGGIAFVLLTVFAWLFAAYFVKPVRDLMAGAQQVSQGDLEQPVPVRGQDELGVLAQTFNDMRQQILAQLTALRTSQDQLEEANRTLEARVAERTAQLVTAHAAITALNAQLQAENLRMGAELDVTRKLQHMLLPTAEELRQIADLDIACYMEPAAEVGGDYYDVLQHNGQIKIGIGDVTGHGLESGVLMVMTQAIVRALLTNGETDPVRFLDTLNRALYGNVQRMGTDKNLTLALLDYAAGDVRLSGQHEKMLVVRGDGTVEVVDTIDLGFPVALTDEIAEFIQHITVRLQPGDGVVLYTDGITEAENPAREQYGLARLCTVVSQHWTAPAEVIKECVVTDVHQHMGAQRMYDDITLVVVKRR